MLPPLPPVPLRNRLNNDMRTGETSSGDLDPSMCESRFMEPGLPVSFSDESDAGGRIIGNLFTPWNRGILYEYPRPLPLTTSYLERRAYLRATVFNNLVLSPGSATDLHVTYEMQAIGSRNLTSFPSWRTKQGGVRSPQKRLQLRIKTQEDVCTYSSEGEYR